MVNTQWPHGLNQLLTGLNLKQPLMFLSSHVPHNVVLSLISLM